MVLKVATHGVELVFKIIIEVALQEKEASFTIKRVLVARRLALWLLFSISHYFESKLLLWHRWLVRLGCIATILLK